MSAREVSNGFPHPILPDSSGAKKEILLADQHRYTVGMPNDRIDLFTSGASLPYEQLQTTPILDIAARVWEPDRYACFKICYASMRLLDDLVDNAREAHGRLTEAQSDQLRLQLNAGLLALEQERSDNPLIAQFIAQKNRFFLPSWPWKRLATAMQYDLGQNGFTTFHQFLRYCEGAAIAPASVFMHLCGVQASAQGYKRPAFDIRKKARALALFAYLTHIVRDLFVDHRRGLNYFSDDLLARFGFDRVSISSAVMHGTEQTPNRRTNLIGLVGEYLRLAARYQEYARIELDCSADHFQPPYGLSLELIYSLYTQQFEQLQRVYQTLDEPSWSVPSSKIAERIEQTLATHITK